MTKANLALALAALFERGAGTRDAALDEIDAALAAFREAGAEGYAAQAESMRTWIAGE
jgi:hypothetical protein